MWGEEMSTKEIVGNRLRNLRGNETVKEVNEALNISTSALTMYETGKRMPRDEIKVLLAQFYHTSIEALFLNKKYTILVF